MARKERSRGIGARSDTVLRYWNNSPYAAGKNSIPSAADVG